MVTCLQMAAASLYLVQAEVPPTAWDRFPPEFRYRRAQRGAKKRPLRLRLGDRYEGECIRVMWVDGDVIWGDDCGYGVGLLTAVRGSGGGGG